MSTRQQKRKALDTANWARYDYTQALSDYRWLRRCKREGYYWEIRNARLVITISKSAHSAIYRKALKSLRDANGFE